MNDSTPSNHGIENSSFDEWPVALRTLFDGASLETHTGFTASLLAADEGSIRTSLLSLGELFAPDARTLCFSLWPRSRAARIIAKTGRATLTLEQLRATHPLASALPVIRRLLVEDASEAGVVVAVTAADGTLLWVEGDRAACQKAQAMNFVPGADWSERSAGTNAPGTALALVRELQIRGSEHFTRIVQPWSCTAVPVHDPVTGMLLGAIDLTGGAEVASPQTLALVRATAVAVENHLALLRLTNSGRPGPANARLSVLGAERPRWTASLRRLIFSRCWIWKRCRCWRGNDFWVSGRTFKNICIKMLLKPGEHFCLPFYPITMANFG